MKTLIIYSSQTGFTKQYATWIAEETGAELIPFKEAKKKNDAFYSDADTILFGGWSMGGNLVNKELFTEKASLWKDKKLVLFCVGATPNDDPDIEESLQKMLTDEEKEYVKAFYCQGGLNYDNMKLPSKLMMKAFASAIKRKKNPTDMERDMAKWIDHSYDISDEKFVEPIVNYIEEDI